MVLGSSQKYLLGEFVEEYIAGGLDRRGMLGYALRLTGGVAATAAALRAAGVRAGGVDAAFIGRGRIPATLPLAALRSAQPGEPGAATAPPVERTTTPVVPEDDPDVSAAAIEIPGEAGAIFAYLARPVRDGRFPAILMSPEPTGEEPNRDIARRYAKEGFVVLVVDLTSRAGGFAAVSAMGAMSVFGVLGRLSDDERLADMTAGVEYLKTLPFVDTAAGFGATGFCFGGNQVWLLAARNPDIRAAAPYYGSADTAAIVNTNAAILGLYAENDPNVTREAPNVEAALTAAGKTFELVIYPGAQHQFFNNISARYDPMAARDAWRRTLAWFRRYLTA